MSTVVTPQPAAPPQTTSSKASMVSSFWIEFVEVFGSFCLYFVPIYKMWTAHLHGTTESPIAVAGWFGFVAGAASLASGGQFQGNPLPTLALWIWKQQDGRTSVRKLVEQIVGMSAAVLLLFHHFGWDFPDVLKLGASYPSKGLFSLAALGALFVGALFVGFVALSIKLGKIGFVAVGVGLLLAVWIGQMSGEGGGANPARNLVPMFWMHLLAFSYYSWWPTILEITGGVLAAVGLRRLMMEPAA